MVLKSPRFCGVGFTLEKSDFVKDLDEDVTILSCHAHFLKDIGKDLLEPSYDGLRKLLRFYGFKASLQRLIREWGQQLGIRVGDGLNDHPLPTERLVPARQAAPRSATEQRKFKRFLDEIFQEN